MNFIIGKINFKKMDFKIVHLVKKIVLQILIIYKINLDLFFLIQVIQKLDK